MSYPTIKVVSSPYALPDNVAGPVFTPKVVVSQAPTQPPLQVKPLPPQPKLTVTKAQSQPIKASKLPTDTRPITVSGASPFQKKPLTVGSAAQSYWKLLTEPFVKINKAGFNLTKAVVQGTARSGAAIAVTGAKLGEKVSEDVFGNKIIYRVPESVSNKYLFGDKPVGGLTSEGSETFKAFGAEGLANNPFASFALGGVLAGLDFTPSGKADDVVKQLAKMDDVSKIVKTLTKSGVVDNVAKDYAPIIAKTTNPTEVKQILQQISRVGVIKPSGFSKSIKKAANVADDFKKQINTTYKTVANAVDLDKASTIIKNSPELAVERAFGRETDSVTNMIRQKLIVEWQDSGRMADAIRLAEHTSKEATKAGQFTQALSVFGKLKPEGIIRYATKQLDLASKTLKLTKKLKLKPEVAEELIRQAREIGKLTDGRVKDVAIANLLKTISDQIPVSVLKKVSTFQTMTQLLNPKTIIRNIIGNFGFGVTENVKDVVATAIDKTVSVVTRQRTKALPSLSTQIKGFIKGGKLGIDDAMKGINTFNAGTQFDLPTQLVFKSPVLKPAEKLLNIVLRAPDRAFYMAAFEDSLRQQAKAKGITNLVDITDEMKEVAHLDGLLRTFQDDNVVSKGLSGLKRVLNLGKDFGIGDLTIKYPKTPGSLLKRGIEYSPAGFFESVLELARPLVGQQFNQKQFVESTARALTGTAGLVGTGAILHRLGIISGRKDEDKDINAVKDLTGFGQYRINLSALKRFAFSLDPEQAKPQPDDVTINYDWFQPAAIGIAMGANINDSLSSGKKEDYMKLVNVVGDAISRSIDTVAEQPVLRGLISKFKYGDTSEAIWATLESLPSSFVPSFLNQFRQLVDETARNTYDPDTQKRIINSVLNRIPGTSKFLEPQITVFGERRDLYRDGSNNLFNVFLNPAFTAKIANNPDAQLVLDIYANTGETQQAPRLIGKTQTVNGESIKLTPEQIKKLQTYTGTVTKKYFERIRNSKDFAKMSDEQKASYMAEVLTDISTAGKIRVLGHNPQRRSKRVIKILEEFKE